MMSENRPQPPPEIQPLPVPSSWKVESLKQETSRVVGWIRISKRADDHWEVYFKNRNDLMVLLCHSLSYQNAINLQHELQALLKRYNYIPFTPGESNVKRDPVQGDEQAQGQVQGGVEASKRD